MTFDASIYQNLVEHIQEQLDTTRPLIIAIDGMCGSGKTSLAEYLSSRFDAAIIHMDNFFLPFERKTAERLAEPGGNIDYERFLELMVPALQEKNPFSYIAYNCQTQSYDRTIEIPACELIIVEGSYSLHKEFPKYFDLSLFLCVSYEEQLKRLEYRCQDSYKFNRFKNEWIPMENYYHDAQKVLDRVDLVIDTTNIQA